MGDPFKGDYTSTIGVDFEIKPIQVDGKNVNLQIVRETQHSTGTRRGELPAHVHVMCDVRCAYAHARALCMFMLMPMHIDTSSPSEQWDTGMSLQRSHMAGMSACVCACGSYASHLCLFAHL